MQISGWPENLMSPHLYQVEGVERPVGIIHNVWLRVGIVHQNYCLANGNIRLRLTYGVSGKAAAQADRFFYCVYVRICVCVLTSYLLRFLPSTGVSSPRCTRANRSCLDSPISTRRIEYSNYADHRMSGICLGGHHFPDAKECETLDPINVHWNIHSASELSCDFLY